VTECQTWPSVVPLFRPRFAGTRVNTK